jgi:uncharacterized membrane protein YkgB
MPFTQHAGEFDTEFPVDQTCNLNGFCEPWAAMDTLIEFASQRIAVTSGIVMVLLAALPAVLFLAGGRNLRYSAIAVLVGAVTLLLFGIEGVTGAVVIVIADILVVSAAILTMYKRIVQVEAKLDAAKSAIRELEIMEGRRQVFSAKTSIERVTSSASR